MQQPPVPRDPSAPSRLVFGAMQLDRTKLAICAALAALTLLAFADVRNAGFLTFDDDTYVTGSPHVRNGLTAEGLRWSLTAVVSANWHPVTLWSHMLDVQLFGLRPAAHHAVNVAFHAANSVLVFLLLARMTGAIWRAAFVGALFAIHPVHVESVAWVSERKDVLSTLFWLGALLAWVSWVQGGSWRAYLLSLALLCAGLLAKSMLVTLPFVLLLFDVWPLRRLAVGDALSPRAVWPLVREKLPFFAAAVGIAAGAMFTQGRAGPMWTLDTLPLDVRAANAVVSYVRYLGHTFWPVDLAIYYPHPLGWSAGPVLGSLALLVAVSAALWRLRERAAWAGVGWLFFLGTLVPAIGLVQVGNQAMADRYIYVPVLGIFWAVTWAVCDAAAARPRARPALRIAAVAVLAVCFGLTVQSVVRWRDTRSLFEHALAVTGPNPTARATVAWLDRADGRLDAALAQIDEAIRIQPRYALAHAYRGRIQLQRRDLPQAIASYARSVELQPRAETLFDLADIHDLAGDLAQAERRYREGLALEPDTPAMQNRLGRVRARQGDRVGAMAIFEAILERHPDDAMAHESLGLVFEEMAHDERAAAHYARALESSPHAVRRLGWIRASHPRASLRNGAEAVRLGERACRESEYRNAGDLDLLAAGYAEAGRHAEAVQMAERARRQAAAPLAAEIESRLQLYRQGRAYRRPARLMQPGGGE